MKILLFCFSILPLKIPLYFSRLSLYSLLQLPLPFLSSLDPPVPVPDPYIIACSISLSWGDLSTPSSLFLYASLL